MERSDRAAWRPFSVHSADPLKEITRIVPLRTPRRSVSAGDAAGEPGVPLRRPSDVILPRRESSVSPSQGTAPGASRSTKSRTRNPAVSTRVSPRSPSGRRLDSIERRSQYRDAQRSWSVIRSGGKPTRAFSSLRDTTGFSPSESSRRPFRTVTTVAGALPRSVARREETFPSNSSAENAFSGFVLGGIRTRNVRVFQQDGAVADVAAEQGDQLQVHLEGLDRSGRQAGYVEGDAADHDPWAGEEA